MASYTLTSHDIASTEPDRTKPDLALTYRRRLSEEFGGWWPFPRLWADDALAFGMSPGGAGFRSPFGTVSDRKGGRDLPLFWNEIDLRGFRSLSRQICDGNDFAIGFLTLLVGYNVRKGFGWQACKAGHKKTPYPTTMAMVDPLVAKGQAILDRWRDANSWPLMSREAFRRWRRDGEVFGRFFRSGWDRLPAFRFIEPEQVGSPTGDADGPQSFGIDCDPDDVRTVWAYHIWDLDTGGATGEWADADRIIHLKANVDSTIKRGVPDFLPVHELLDGVRRLMRNMVWTSIDQAAIAWRESFPTATPAQVRQLIPQQTDSSNQEMFANWWINNANGAGSIPGINKFRPGTVIRTEGNRGFEPGPVSQGVPNFVQVIQAALRGCCTRWNIPEYATGDASNNNYASSLVAGSPFSVTVEGTQLEFGAGWERPVALKVLDLATEAGLLSREERRQLDIEVTEPALVTPEPEKESQRIVSLVGAKLLSPQTAQLQLQLDPQHEAENWRAYQPPADPGQPPTPGPGGNPLSPQRIVRPE